MSHGDCVKYLPEGFQEISRSENGNLAIMGDEKRKIYGLQVCKQDIHGIDDVFAI